MFIHFAEEVSRSVVPSPSGVGVEETLANLVLWVKLFVEIAGAFLIGIGGVWTFARFLGVLRKPSVGAYERTRLLLARFLSVGLEFQLAADILGTTVAPSWTQIGQLGAIAVIRTGLNYFLAREMKEEEVAVESELDDEVSVLTAQTSLPAIQE